MANAVSFEKISELKKNKYPSYNLNINCRPSKQNDAQVMIVCHGYGHNNTIANVINSYHVTSNHIIGFDFPDHDIRDSHDHTKATFGTIQEILPLLFLLKKCVVELELRKINLYGFSAGGGAIVNTIAALLQNRFDTELKSIGITIDNKKLIMAALEQGIVILDCPLKSMEELNDFRGRSKQRDIITQNYALNNMRPIDVLNTLSGLNLTIAIHFQNPDEILSNRDDQIFIDRLQKINAGKTIVVIGNEGGHNSFHRSLWNELYAKNLLT